MRGLIAGLLVLVTGCIEASLVPCGDQLCAVDWVCTPDLRCATPQAVAACVGRMEGDLCGDDSGACHSSACWPITCGDQVVDLGEVCDDGNETSLDGCSATCSSDETCGNATVDPGEDCDLGVAGLSSDGCSSTCKLELARWISAEPTLISGRNAAAMAYDSARQQVVVFGGYGAEGVLGDMWIWNGTEWREIALGLAPSPRAHAVMVYDAARAQVILFGGVGNAGALGDTWAWNGATWTQLAPSQSPSPRAHAVATYDSARQRIVMFGGAGDASTWEWDGTTWIERVVPGPSPRIWSMMAYDSKRSETVLYGGLSGANTGLQDTWVWDGTTWSERDGAGTPAASFGAGMAYDPQLERVILVGGRSPAFADVSATWEWDGTTWSGLGAFGGLRYHPSVVFDGAAQDVRLFGGLTQSTWRNDTMTWTLGQWDSLVVAPFPIEPRGRAAIAYDARRGQVLLHGGYRTAGGSMTYNDFWTWQRGGWRQLVTGAITPRHSHTLTYDPHRERSVLFGGIGSGGRFDQTWEWTGSSWTRVLPPTSPPPRNSHGAAYDLVSRRLIVFGGFGDGQVLSDTWSYDGATWTQLAPATSPPPRGGMTMVYDAARRNIVMFGGDDSGTRYGDTWLFDGTTWTQASPVNAPTPRYLHAMYYDPVRERVVMTGGIASLIANDTWEWDGTTWRERVEAPNVASWGAAIEYNTVERRSISYGGFGSITTYGTRSLVFDSPFASEEQCRGADVDDDGDGLAGCDDPDCWGRCKPLCPPAQSCPPDAPRCGDGVCGPVEDALICPADC